MPQPTYAGSTLSSSAKVRSRASTNVKSPVRASSGSVDIPPSSYQNFKRAVELASFAPSKKTKKANDLRLSTQ